MPAEYDATFVDNLKPNVAVLFLDRVAKPPVERGVPLPAGRGLGVGDLAAGGRPGRRRWPRACCRSGIEPEQRVGIASGTRYEWILADLAVMCAGGATTTVYP